MDDQVHHDDPASHLDEAPPPVIMRLVRSLAGLLLIEHSLQAVLQRVATLATELPGVEEAAAVVVGGRTPTHTTAFTGLMAYELDETAHRPGFGPCLHAATTGQTVSIPDVGHETRWPAWTVLAVGKGALSALAVPLQLTAPASRAPLTAAMARYGTAPHTMGEDTSSVTQSFAAHAGTTLSNMIALELAQRSAAGLQTAMQSRAIIEQAKGMLMERHTVTADQAFTQLATMSQNSNRKVSDLAREMVGGGGTPQA